MRRKNVPQRTSKAKFSFRYPFDLKRQFITTDTDMPKGQNFSLSKRCPVVNNREVPRCLAAGSLQE
jgi:hypothetical protein